jgi:FkbM family methyltransferase
LPDSSEYTLAATEPLTGHRAAVTLESGREDIRVLNEIWFDDVYRLNRQPWSSSEPNVVVDVGANRGYFSSRIQMIAPHAHLYCVEPHPTNIALLRRNVRQSFFQGEVSITEAALVPSDDVDHVQLHLGTLPGRHTVLEQQDTDPLGTIDVRAVFIRTFLDEVLKAEGNISFLKLDVEGLEEGLISQLTETHWKSIHACAAEVGPERPYDLERHLRELGRSVEWDAGYLYIDA